MKEIGFVIMILFLLALCEPKELGQIAGEVKLGYDSATKEGEK